VKDVVVTAGAEAFGVESHFSFASFAGHTFRGPLEFFVAGVAEAFGVMLFFLIAINTDFYHHVLEKAFVYKNFVQTGYFRSFYHGRTSYNLCCANFQ